VIFKPLDDTITEAEAPVTVTFLVNADQLAGLVVLANYGRPGFENVSIPFVAGCQAIGILPYREAKSEAPRAVVGNIDISARFYTRKTLGGTCSRLPFRSPCFARWKRTWRGVS